MKNSQSKKSGNAAVSRLPDYFHSFAQKTSSILGSPWMFSLAVAIILIWAALGPVFKYSDPWQLMINTGTTIVTFLMVFLIQNTQNRDARAIHLKLDELLRAVDAARTGFVDLEELSEAELEQLHKDFQELHKQYGTSLQSKMTAVQEALGERRGKGKKPSSTRKKN